jgi:hypothetical protein
MLLVIDTASMARVTFARETTVHGDQRRYYTAAAPARTVVVFRNGLDLEGLAHEVVEAQVATAAAPAGNPRPGNERQQYTIISVLRKVHDLADYMLWRVIEEGQQDGVV